MWNLHTGSLIRNLNGYSAASGYSVAISPDGKKIVSGGTRVSMISSPDKGKTLVSRSVGNNTIKVWDLMTGEQINTFKGHSNSVDSVAISPDAQTLVSGSSDKTIKVWNFQTGQLLCSLKGHSWIVTSVAISPNGETFVSSSLDKTIKIWGLSL